MFRARASLFVSAASLVFAALVPAIAEAHIIPGGLTLHQMARAADVIAAARIERAGDEPRGAGPLPPVEARILELFREGDAKVGPIRFVPHRHAGESYVVGEEILLFLERRRPDAKDAAAVPYESVEAIADRIVLVPATRATWIDATRAYAALGKGERTGGDAAALGRVTLSMLGSAEARIATFALRDLTLAGAAPLIGEADVPALTALLDDAARPATLRVGLLMELERRKLVPVGPRWIPLLRAAPPNDRVQVIRAAAARAFVPAVTAELGVILEKGERDAAIAAARALGSEGNAAAVEPLGRAVDREPDELRFAALGSLRRVGSPAAREILARVAKSHPDPETRRVATTEQNLLDARASAPPPASAGTSQSRSPSGAGLGLKGIVLGIVAVVLACYGLFFLRRGKGTSK
ncbi:HEAT repeat domain-containing protein [Polyangium sp. 6x1]|uniref:HEAT repeat domain-containing protein n=1 Tax=Polyangium sp. 6x1 TaxID=3042689 RepID=UPI002482EEE5|nr:HEAT repeat domain-containing protein [Polyangium sp. 6x1]MDI1445518.1 HEAT repeat domain-containing protein [Polyangium sp. 6x1]